MYKSRVCTFVMLAVTASVTVWFGVTAIAGVPACDPVRGEGDTTAFAPAPGEPPCYGGPGFEGSGTLVIRGEEFEVGITTCLLGEPVPGDDGTLHGATSHTFAFGDPNNPTGWITTFDKAVLDPTEVPGVFRLNSNMEIISGDGDFEDARGRLHANGEIDLFNGWASFDLTGVVCN